MTIKLHLQWAVIKMKIKMLVRDAQKACQLFRIMRQSRTTTDEFLAIVDVYSKQEPIAQTAKFYIDCTYRAKRTDMDVTKNGCNIRFNFNNWD